MRKTQRRQFFHTAVAGSVAASTAALFSLSHPAAQTSAATVSATPSTLWKTAIGLNGFESGERKYKKRYPIWEILDFASQTGFQGVELVGNWPQGGYPASADTVGIKSLKRLYQAYGLSIFSIQLGADGAFAPDPDVRKRWLGEFEDRVRLARQLGCSHVGLWPGGGLRGQSLDTAIDVLSGSFQEAVRIASREGITPGFEIEPPFVFNTEEHMQRILKQSGMKFIYDPSHCDLFNGSSGKPHEVLLRLGVEHVAYVHLTDTDGTLRDGGTSKHLPAGDGHAQLDQSLKALREGGFRGWIMVDEWEVPDPYDACRKALALMQTASRRV